MNGSKSSVDIREVFPRAIFAHNQRFMREIHFPSLSVWNVNRRTRVKWRFDSNAQNENSFCFGSFAVCVILRSCNGTVDHRTSCVRFLRAFVGFCFLLFPCCVTTPWVRREIPFSWSSTDHVRAKEQKKRKRVQNIRSFVTDKDRRRKFIRTDKNASCLCVWTRRRYAASTLSTTARREFRISSSCFRRFNGVLRQRR